MIDSKKPKTKNRVLTNIMQFLFSEKDEAIEKNHYDWADVAKGICILAVVAGHMKVASINRIVFLWHLPVFFILAGYFLHVKPTFVMIKRKAKRLLIPYYLTCLVICIIVVFRSLIEKRDIVDQLSSWLKAALYAAGDSWNWPFQVRAIGAIWYLWALFFAIIIVNFFIEKKCGFIFIILISVCGWLSYELTGKWLPLSIQAGLFCSLYLALGYEAKKRNVDFSNVGIILTTISFVILLIGIYFFKGYWLVHNYMGNGWFDFFISIFASIFIMSSAGLLARRFKKIKRILMFYGKNSILILCLHLIEVNVVRVADSVDIWLKLLSLDPAEPIRILIILLTKVLLLAIMVLVLRKLPLVKKVFYPMRNHGIVN